MGSEGGAHAIGSKVGAAQMRDQVEVDVTHLWRLEEVADAALEIPLESQPQRLRTALASLVKLPVSWDDEIGARPERLPKPS